MIQTKTSLKAIAVAGNPNAGKTTVFNALAGARQKVANYPGVTVERKEATLRLPAGETVHLIDLPGCYSLTARSPEEQIAHDVLFGRVQGVPAPSLVLCVVDASNLERNLYLATQLIDQGMPLLVVLNMMDLAAEKGTHIDAAVLEKTLGCPVIPTVARRGQGLTEVLSRIDTILGAPHLNGTSEPAFIESLPANIAEPVNRLAEHLSQSGQGASRPEALWKLLANLDGDEAVHLPPLELELTRKTLEGFHLSTGDLRKQESEARYRYITRLLERAGVSHEDHPHTLTERLDALFLHPILAPILFVAVFALVFQSIFSWAGPAMDGIKAIFALLSTMVDGLLPDSMFKDLIVQGIIGGVGNTVVFLPQILILFFFLGLLEDTGYLARAAFLMDRLMSSVGLDGKAFIPLLSSFACAVPGIMATRTIPSRKDRLVTILIAPLMTCSARLPVYTLLIGTVFAADRRVFGFMNLGGVVMFILYFSGIAAAVLVAAVFKKTFLKSPKPVLLLELPTYKMPSLRSIGLMLWDRSLLFLRRAGTVILAVTILLWGLLSFPRDQAMLAKYRVDRAVIETQKDLSEEARGKAIAQLDAVKGEQILSHSLGGRIGHALRPVISPLGFDWKMGVGLVASFAAREVFVSTMGVIYGIGGDVNEENVSLRDALRAEKRPGTDIPLFTPLVGLSLMFFYVFACQCMSTLAVVRRETNSWRWPAFLFVYMTTLAWVASFTVYQVGSALGYQ